MDIIRKLRELRELRGLTQRDVAKKSGVDEKTISSFETGDRIDAMTVVQLQKLLAVYGVTECDFFGTAVEFEIAPWKQPIGDITTVTRPAPTTRQSAPVAAPSHRR